MEKSHKEGYAHFLDNYFEKNRDLFKELEDQQSPDTMLITCSDSRIDPTLILNAKPGELFVARNIGNAVPPFNPSQGSTQAAVEYAVNALNVKRIVILGHSNCGACAHLYHEHKEEDAKLIHVDNWLKFLQPAKGLALLECKANPDKSLSEATEKHNIVLSLERLMTYPYIEKRIESKEIELLGWWYNIGSGEVEKFNFVTHQFEKVEVTV